MKSMKLAAVRKRVWRTRKRAADYVPRRGPNSLQAAIARARKQINDLQSLGLL